LENGAYAVILSSEIAQTTGATYEEHIDNGKELLQQSASLNYLRFCNRNTVVN
jgi:hypothetical protein